MITILLCFNYGSKDLFGLLDFLNSLACLFGSLSPPFSDISTGNGGDFVHFFSIQVFVIFKKFQENL